MKARYGRSPLADAIEEMRRINKVVAEMQFRKEHAAIMSMLDGKPKKMTGLRAYFTTGKKGKKARREWITS
jgi:Mg-chelatase subunit ChlD